MPCNSLTNFEYRISANSFFFEFGVTKYVVRKLFKGGNYSNSEYIHGNTV